MKIPGVGNLKKVIIIACVTAIAIFLIMLAIIVIMFGKA